MHEERHGVGRDAVTGADGVQSFGGGCFDAYIHHFYPQRASNSRLHLRYVAREPGRLRQDCTIYVDDTPLPFSQ